VKKAKVSALKVIWKQKWIHYSVHWFS